MTAQLTVPQVDVGAPFRAPAIAAAMERVRGSGWYILGGEVSTFEREFSSFLGVPHAIGVANGTDAVELALRAVGVEAGDRVLTVSHTAVATVSAIRRCGAIPVFADVDRETCVMSPVTLRDAIAREPTGDIKAVVVVHLYGCPADMAGLLPVARAAGLAVIEDCAQAHGARIGETKVGTFGDAAAFSFYPTKNLGTMGDGGLVATTTDSVAERLRELRQYGWRERYISASEGVNSRLDELQAAVLRELLPMLDARNARRRAVAAAYAAGFADLPVTIPVAPVGRTHVYHQYVIRVGDRERIAEALREKGIGTAVHYPVPVHMQPAYEPFARGVELPVSEEIRGEILSLPMFPELTDAQVQHVVSSVRSLFA